MSAVVYTVIKEVEANPWAWNWAAVAAVATGLLAAVTALLAFSTKRLAKATNEDVRSEWRPILIGAATGDDGSSQLTVRRYETTPGKAELSLIVTNVGKGPALNIWIKAVSVGCAEESITPAASLGTLGHGTENIHQAVSFTDQPLPREGGSGIFGYIFLLTYDDISGNTYYSSLRYDRQGTMPEGQLFTLPVTKTTFPPG